MTLVWPTEPNYGWGSMISDEASLWAGWGNGQIHVSNLVKPNSKLIIMSCSNLIGDQVREFGCF